MRNNIQRWFAPLVAAIALIAITSQARATLLPPGGSVSPVPAADASGTILADTGLKSWDDLAGDKGTIRQIVVADTLNPFGSGLMTFIYQVSVTMGTAEHVTGASFTGWLTDVSQFTPHAPFDTTGDQVPSSANRTADGRVVSFNFATAIVAGKTSVALLIRTNAPTFHPGTIGIIDGGGATADGFAPAPEPTSLVLLASCFLGLGGAYAWRRRSVVPVRG